MSHIVITEAGTLSGVDLSDDEAARLNRAGKTLAGGPYWRDRDEDHERRVVKCVRTENGWDISAGNVIGVIGLGARTLHIQPKINLRHLLYLLDEASAIPRIDSFPVDAERDTDFVEVVVGWFISSVEQLVRSGLHRDYEEIEDETAAVQGQLLIMPTSLNLYRGRPLLSCRFDEYSFDNAPNRVIAEALRRLQRIPGLNIEHPRQARGLLAEFPSMGLMRYGDLGYRPDRNTLRYETPLELARQVIDCTGRRPDTGQDTAMGFILPTPATVEKGIRNLIRPLVPADILPQKGSMLLAGGVTVEPDFVFGRRKAVGEVKYRILNGEWDREGFLQLTTYAEAYETVLGVLIGFANHPFEVDDVRVGRHRLRQLVWVATEETDPTEQAERLARNITAFLRS